MENNDLIEGVLSSHSAEADDYPELCQYEIDSTSGKQCIHTLMISNIEWIDPQIKCAIFTVNKISEQNDYYCSVDINY